MMKNYFKLFTLLILCFLSTQTFGQENKALIDSYLSSNIEKYDLLVNDLENWIILSDDYSEKSQVTHTYIQQTHQGIPIFNAVGNVAIKNNIVKRAKLSFLKNIATKINSTTPSINAQRAINEVASQLNLGSTNSISLIETISSNKFIFSNAGISQENIPVDLVYQLEDDGSLKLAWQLNVFQLDGKHWWNIRVDAISGMILNKNDWTVSCNFDHKDSNHIHSSKKPQLSEAINLERNAITAAGESYNVYELPSESPSHSGRTNVSEPQSLAASPYGWQDTNGVAGPEYTITRGNNVYAQEDANANNGFGYAPDAGASLNFDFPVNLNQAPLGNRDAALTNLFYANNMMHDIWFNAGFTERAGNFQQNNYGNGGTAGDFVVADGQDGSGTNNANFSTPNDGSSPRMQMFIWDPSNLKELVTINGGTLNGTYIASNPSTGAGANGVGNITGASTTAVTGNLVLVSDNNDNSGGNNPASTDSNDGCDTVTNTAAINGNIAVIRRGACPFTDKIQNAQAAGAIAVIVVNYHPSDTPAGQTYTEYVSMYGVTTPTFTIPSVFVNFTDGAAIIAALNNGETINTTIQDYVSYNLDASFDNQIIAHEYGHGISNRLIGGRNNTSCMSNNEQMGEGWSDFFGLMITIEPGDVGETARGIATYSAGQPTSGQGIRTQAYSTDMAVNTFTFASSNTEVAPHGLGSVWCQMIWDLNWRMIGAYGYDADLYNGTGGNNMTMELVIEGLKNTPCSSGFVAARDAIIEADEDLFAGVNKCLIWQVFSRRGLGYSANSGSNASNTDQVEAFDMPPAVVLNGTDCALSVTESIADSFNIFPNPSNGEININVIKDLGTANATIFDLNGRKVYTKQLTLNGNANLKATSLTPGFYILKIKGENFTHTEKLIIE